MYEFSEKKRNVALEPYVKLCHNDPIFLSDLHPKQFRLSFNAVQFLCTKLNREQRILKCRNEADMDYAYPSTIQDIPQGVGIYDFSKFHESFFTYTILKELFFSHTIPKLNNSIILVAYSYCRKKIYWYSPYHCRYLCNYSLLHVQKSHLTKN